MLANGELQYDYLVIGLGAVPETFGIKGLKEYAFPIANINTSRLLREHIELQFATYHTEAEKRPDRLTIVVGGAGFTGIEFLGELAARVPELCKEYDVDRSLVRIICVEAAPTVLHGFDPELVDYAVHYLEENGVEFKIGTAVQECTPEGVRVGKKMKNLSKSNRKPLYGRQVSEAIRLWRKPVLKICAAGSKSILTFAHPDMTMSSFSATARYL